MGEKWIRSWISWDTAKILTASIATFVLGITVKGDWALLFVNLCLPFNHNETQRLESGRALLLIRAYLKDVDHYIIPSLLVTLISFFGMAGFFHRWFYVYNRDKEAEWKCQPGKYLTKDNENHALMMSTINLTVGSILSGIIACAINNGLPTKFYYTFSKYGYVYAVVSAIVAFLFVDGVGFYTHKTYHRPFLYKWIHKWHHRYQQPMVWTVAAMHPIEFMTYQIMLSLPMFLFPIHPYVLVSIMVYFYYYGVIDHSGIKMAAIWPWQPHSTFHDNHHKFYHCNFGFNTGLFDWLHGTRYRNDRLYSESIFGGKGAPDMKED